MSRLGKKPLPIPEKVKVEIKNNTIVITGPLGTLTQPIQATALVARVENNQVFIEAKNNTRETNMMHGLVRGLLKNNLEGVVKGYKKDVEISGLGFKAVLDGKNLNMTIGFSHPVVFPIPEGIKVAVEKQTIVSISGIDKALVGEVAASIRGKKPAEPYTGTGLKYVGETIIRKAGKAAAGGKK